MKEKGIVAAGLLPHPPLAVPKVGKGEEEKIKDTLKSFEKVAKSFIEAAPDTLVLITPHGPCFSDVVYIRDSKKLRGDLKEFGAQDERVLFQGDTKLIDSVAKEMQGLPVAILSDWALRRYDIPEGLDHGSVVPLWFFKEHDFTPALVVINIGILPYISLYKMGMAIDRAAKSMGRKVAVLASGDLSHRLKEDGPYGLHPSGRKFDEKLLKDLSEFDVPEVLFMDETLVEEAAECGLRPITLLLGALDEYEVEPKLLSYEGVFGVGYGAMLFLPKGETQSRLPNLCRIRTANIRKLRENESFPVSLARNTVEAFVSKNQVFEPSFCAIPRAFRQKGGVFVTIYKEGALRGCIGTTEGTKPDLAREIVANAISACSNDPRFSPVTEDEIPLLSYSVDVLSTPENVDEYDELDPKKHGIVVEKGNRRGLLLPDLPGVDTVEKQISIAKEKAGIRDFEKVKLFCFTVKRYR